jgi:hypothetical protein
MASGQLSSLKVLELSSNRITDGPRDTAIVALASALRKGGCPDVQTLVLDDTDVGDAGLQRLAKAFDSGGAIS